MVKVNASTLGHLTISSKALNRMLALEAEVSRLRYHVSVLSKRLNKYESAGRVLFMREKPKFFPGKGEDKLLSFWVGKAVGEEEEIEEVAERVEGRVEEVADSEAEVVEEVATVEAEEEASVVGVDLDSVAGGSVASGGSVKSSDVSMSGDSDKVVVVDGRVKMVAPKELASMRVRERREYGFGSGFSSAGLIFDFAGGAGRGVGRKDIDPRLVAGGGSTPAAVGISRWPDAWRQSPGVSEGYQLRLGVGGFRGRGYGGYGRGREVQIISDLVTLR